jgi:hypothetical protein
MRPHPQHASAGEPSGSGWRSIRTDEITTAILVQMKLL